MAKTSTKQHSFHVEWDLVEHDNFIECVAEVNCKDVDFHAFIAMLLNLSEQDVKMKTAILATAKMIVDNDSQPFVFDTAEQAETHAIQQKDKQILKSKKIEC